MTFLEKYELIKKSVPVPAVYIDQYTTNCKYVDYAYTSQNCYYCFDILSNKDCLYSTLLGLGSKLVDCFYVTDSDKCYECVESNYCNTCTYLVTSNYCTNCNFSALLNSCTDCFGCVGLSNKKYCILNNQLTKAQYEKAVIQIKKELG